MDQLKIDREFVKNILDEPNDAMICFTSIGMAHCLRLEVVAEGAETADQVAFLRSYSCDLGQGFFYTRPLPGDGFEKQIGRGDWHKDLP